MVIAIDKVAETVAIAPRPGYREESVFSHVEFSDHRRHKEQVNFRPVLHPVRYSDTAYVYINNTRKRFVSRTFYEPRVRPRSFAETTFNNPKTMEHHYVAYLDHHVDEKKKWFKTCVEIKAKKFTSAQVLRSQNNNYINTSGTTTILSSSGMLSPDFRNSFYDQDGGLDSELQGQVSLGSRSFREKFDPGASQVFIPKRREKLFGQDSLINGELLLKFPNSQVELRTNGVTDDFSDA